MVRVKVTVSYDGSKYYGFQIQNNDRSIQEEIQLALFKIHKEETSITGAGRTDKGVHALNQVFNFDTNLNMNEEQWKRSLNTNLPADIYIKKIEFVDNEFHSRFRCLEKTYTYKLNVGEYNPLEKDYVYQLNREVDLDKMNDAAKLFIGKHDFKYFCSNNEQEVKDFTKTIYSFEIIKKDNIVEFIVRGTGFLRYQVRMMVGTLIEIGLGRKDDGIILERLDKKEGTTTSYNAPSCGLYLTDIKY